MKNNSTKVRKPLEQESSREKFKRALYKKCLLFEVMESRIKQSHLKDIFGDYPNHPMIDY